MFPERIWFDVALVCMIHTVGTILFNHFEVGTPKWRRVLKVFVLAAGTALVSATLGQPAVWGLLGLIIVFGVIIHAWWLPKHGINGLTAEPKEKYYALREWKFDGPAA